MDRTLAISNKVGDLDEEYGLVVANAIQELRLNDDQLAIFCTKTPDGAPLWRNFTTRRHRIGTPSDFSFKDYVVEVLTGTHYQLSIRIPA